MTWSIGEVEYGKCIPSTLGVEIRNNIRKAFGISVGKRAMEVFTRDSKDQVTLLTVYFVGYIFEKMYPTFIFRPMLISKND